MSVHLVPVNTLSRPIITLYNLPFHIDLPKFGTISCSDTHTVCKIYLHVCCQVTGYLGLFKKNTLFQLKFKFQCIMSVQAHVQVIDASCKSDCFVYLFSDIQT